MRTVPAASTTMCLQGKYKVSLAAEIPTFDFPVADPGERILVQEAGFGDPGTEKNKTYFPPNPSPRRVLASKLVLGVGGSVSALN